MTFISLKKIEKWTPWSVLILAGAGQFEIGHNHSPIGFYAGLVLYAAALVLFLKWVPKTGAVPSGKGLEPWVEGSLFFLVLLIATSFRFYKLGSIPGGLAYDQGFEGLAALEVLNEHFRPVWDIGHFEKPALLFYPLALWHFFFHPSQETLYSFFAVISLLSFPFIYWTFRQLAGPKIALWASFFLAIMRWHLIFSRNGFDAIETPFFLFGCLAFLLYGFSTSKRWAFLVASTFLGVGLYTYQAFKVVPVLILIYLAHEYRSGPNKFRSYKRSLWLALGLFAILAGPFVYHYGFERGSWGTRESEIFIGNDIAREKSLSPLVDKLDRTLALFNRRGETHPRVNLLDRPLLDDVTGVFFVLGFFLALKFRRDRPFFYALMGFGVMCLPGLLSNEVPQSHRMIGASPFLAFLAAAAFASLGKGLGKVVPRGTWLWVLPAFLALFAMSQNLKTYFIDQAGDYDCWRAYSPETKQVSKAILENPDIRFFLSPGLYHQYSIQYLAYEASARVSLLDLGNLPKGPVGFALEEGKGPTLSFLKTVYPGGREETFRDPRGNNLIYFYYPSVSESPVRTKKGLWGEYFAGNPGEVPILFRRLDPLINFTNLTEFGVLRPPISVRWKGTLWVDKTAEYEFLMLTSDEGGLWLDGKKMIDVHEGASAVIYLVRGPHRMELSCGRKTNPDILFDLHLLWRKAGKGKYEVIPNKVFGEGLK